MPNRLPVPGPPPWEESRQLAEAVADLHYVMGVVVENATQLIPGESVDELTTAWVKFQDPMEGSMATLVQSLAPADGVAPQIAPTTLEQNGLTGEVGKVKRSTLGRLKDCFLMYWNSEPRTEEKRLKAADAAADYFEFGATVASSIPGYGKVVEVLSLGRQLLGIRAKRGV